MDPFVQQAQPIVGQAYDPAVANIQAQIPAIQQLYGSLLQGLQTQNQNQLSNVVNSAAQRGVSSAGLTQGAQMGLADALATQGAQLGVQQAQTNADLRGEVGRANVGRAKAVIQQAGSLSDQDLSNRKNQQAMSDLDRSYALKQEQNQQDYNIKQIQYQRAQAAAAADASKAASSMDLKEFLSKQDATLNKLVGGDGKVSPDTWGKALDLWRQKGLPDSEFVNRYKGYVNRGHVQDYMNAFKR